MFPTYEKDILGGQMPRMSESTNNPWDETTNVGDPALTLRELFHLQFPTLLRAEKIQKQNAPNLKVTPQTKKIYEC